MNTSKPSKIVNSRASAAKVIAKVLNKKIPLDRALLDCFAEIKDPREQRFIQELSYGVLRWHPRLEFIADALLSKPLKQKDSDLKALILLGLYQLEYLRTPDHAAISASVDACKAIKKVWGKNLVNAVLRRYQREKSELIDRVEKTDTAQFAHPAWLIKQLQLDWPEHWLQMLEGNNQRPPMHLRVNLQQSDRDSYYQRLLDKEIEASCSSISNTGISLATAVAVEELPGFKNGDVSVQDIGAQLATSMLNISSNQLHILDACAAPGGKSAHLLESHPQKSPLTAIEIDPHRVSLLEDTKTRLSLNMRIMEADASRVEQWWDGQLFDRILLDVPCSASGVIRRHPDIKLLREWEQMTNLHEIQQALLMKLWPLLKPGGRLLYVTCSVLKQENDEQIEKFCQYINDVNVVENQAEWGIATHYGRQSLPQLDDTDGFYYAILDKHIA